MKKVRALDDIVFDSTDVPLLPKGSVYAIGGVIGNGIILETEAGEQYLIDSDTFEAGFEIAEWE